MIEHECLPQETNDLISLKLCARAIITNWEAKSGKDKDGKDKWVQGIYNGNPQDLLDTVDKLMDGPSVLDHSHIREGVVVRAETPNGRTLFMKSKSWAFGVLEGYLRNDDNYVDTEEVS